MKKNVKIRFNTQCEEGSDLRWRVLIDGIEHLASEISINTNSSTTKDIIEGVGEKWHISCNGDKVVWIGTKCIVI